jgi:hypothetical protein
MNGIVDAAACTAGAAASRSPLRAHAFDPMNRAAIAACQPDNPASFAPVTRSAPTPIIRVPFTDA